MKSRSEKVLPGGQPAPRRAECRLGQRAGQRSGGLEEAEKLNLAEEHFVLIDQWGQAVQLITYAANNGNLEGPRLALSSVPEP